MCVLLKKCASGLPRIQGWYLSNEAVSHSLTTGVYIIIYCSYERYNDGCSAWEEVEEEERWDRGRVEAFTAQSACIVSHIVTFTEVGSSFVNQLCADFL